MPTLGVISDTHGALRPEAVAALEGCDRIVHAGDVGERWILEELSRIAPVTAVRGNTDGGEFGASLPKTEVVDIDGTLFYVLHILEDLDLDPAAAGFSAVIYGHTHRPALETRGGVLYVNPGAAGPRRFDLPVTVARVEVDADGIAARHVDLV